MLGTCLLVLRPKFHVYCNGAKAQTELKRARDHMVKKGSSKLPMASRPKKSVVFMSCQHGSNVYPASEVFYLVGEHWMDARMKSVAFTSST